MPFVSRLKFFVILTCLVLVGQGFAAWNGVDMTPAIKGDDGYYIIDSEAKLAWFANESNKKVRVRIKKMPD